MRRALVVAAVVVTAAGAVGCSPVKEPSPVASKTSNTTSDEITITDPSQREAAVGKPVVVIGIQTRSKQPQVNGVDVDGAYELSDKKVVARGILEKHVVREEPRNEDGLAVASRGPGTYYSLLDPSTNEIAKTKAAD